MDTEVTFEGAASHHSLVHVFRLGGMRGAPSIKSNESLFFDYNRTRGSASRTVSPIFWYITVRNTRPAGTSICVEPCFDHTAPDKKEKSCKSIKKEIVLPNSARRHFSTCPARNSFFAVRHTTTSLLCICPLGVCNDIDA